MHTPVGPSLCQDSDSPTIPQTSLSYPFPASETTTVLIVFEPSLWFTFLWVMFTFPSFLPPSISTQVLSLIVFLLNSFHTTTLDLIPPCTQCNKWPPFHFFPHALNLTHSYISSLFYIFSGSFLPVH